MQPSPAQTAPVTERPARSDGAATKDSVRPARSDGAATKDSVRPARSDGAATKDSVRPARSDGAATKDSVRPARSDGAATKDSAPPRKRRLRSSYVILGSVGTLFAGLCVYGVVRDRDRDRTCVDANHYVISDRECERGSSGARWYYGGSNYGGRMSGGSFERGGFGGHGGGGS